MPTPEEIKRQREYNELIKEENRLRAEREGRTASDLYTRDSVRSAGALVDYAQQLTEEAKEQAGYTNAKSEADRKLVSLARQLSNSAANITSELGREAAVSKQIQSDRKLQREIEISLGNARAQLTAEDAKAQGRLAEAGRRRAFASSELNKLTAEYNRLLAAGADPAGAVLGNLQLQRINQEKLVAKADEEYDLAQQGISDAAKKVANLEEQYDLSTKLVADREAELKIQKEITKATGVTGAVVEGIGGIMQRLGLRSGIFNQAMEDASEEMRKIAGEAKKANKEISKTEVAVAGIAKLLKGLKGGLLDPAVIGGAVLDGFFKVDEAATKLQQITGQNSMNIAGMNGRLATSVDFLEVAAELTALTGMNAQNIFSPDVLAGAAELKNTMGLSADAAGGLAMIAQTTGGNIDATTDAIVDQTSAFNKANRSAVSQGQVLRDVAHASDGIKASFAGMPGALAEAAAAARRMGMDLVKVDQIASSLMDFESSIEAELEAQLLTGKNINMAKARELALNNDLAGLSKELFKNSSSIAEFGKMNRIQQEAQAKALGMTRDELGKIAYQRALETGMTEEQAAAAAGVRAEDMKRLAAQEALQLAAAKLAQAFAPVLSIVGDLANAIAPFVAFLAKIVGFVAGNTLGKIAIGAIVVSKAFGGINGSVFALGKGIKGISKSMMDGLKSIKEYGKALLKVVKDPMGGLKKLQESFKAGLGDKAGELKRDAQGRLRDAKGRFAKDPSKNKVKELASKGKDKVKDVTGGATDKTVDAAKGAADVPEARSSGEKLKEFLTNLGDGLRSLGKKFGEVVKGIVALGLASIAIVGPLAGAMLIIKDVPATAMLAFAASIGVLGGTLALIGKQASAVMKGGIALAAVGVGILAAATGFSLLNGVDPASVIAVTGSLVTLGIAAALLGSLAGNIITGALAIGILGLAMVPAAFALSLLEGVDVGSIIAFSTALPLLGLAAAGLGFLAPFIIAGAGALAVLGAAMIPAAIAFNIMAKADLATIATGLKEIGSVGPQLALAGAGMIGLAAGAGILALASPGLILASGALALLGIASKLVADANFENIANQLTQLGGIGPGLVNAAAGLFAIAGGLMAFAFAMAGASAVSGLSSLLGGGIMGDLETLAAMSDPLAQVGVSLTQIAAGLSGIALALSTLETAKLDELKDLVSTTAFAAPMVAASGAISGMINGITGGGDKKESDNSELLAEIKLLRAAVEKGGDIYMDGNKVGMSLSLATTRQ